MPAAFNEDTTTPGLLKKGDATDEEFADYLKNITSVTVNGKAYAASGRGAVVLFNEDGSLKTDAAPFAEGDSFEITVSSLGYQDLSFTWKKSAEEPTPTPTETPTVTPTETPTVPQLRLRRLHLQQHQPQPRRLLLPQYLRRSRRRPRQAPRKQHLLRLQVIKYPIPLLPRRAIMQRPVMLPTSGDG